MYLKQIQNLHVLGSLKVNRLTIFSFLIHNEQSDLYLHHGFVGALLNDLFGIQSRSGCACAGPFSVYLLGIDDALANIFSNFLAHGTNLSKIVKPGFTRFSLGFFFEEAKVDFILHAIRFVAEFGWMFLHLYTMNLESGEFFHKNKKVNMNLAIN